MQLMVLLMCCYLYRKRSNIINVNAEAKEQGRDMKTPVDNFGIFTEVSVTTQKSIHQKYQLQNFSQNSHVMMNVMYSNPT